MSKAGWMIMLLVPLTFGFCYWTYHYNQRLAMPRSEIERLEQDAAKIKPPQDEDAFRAWAATRRGQLWLEIVGKSLELRQQELHEASLRLKEIRKKYP